MIGHLAGGGNHAPHHFRCQGRNRHGEVVGADGLDSRKAVFLVGASHRVIDPYRRTLRFSLFGSALRGDFEDSSDIDVLVEFLPGRTPGLFGVARMERELSEIMGGRKIDLRTPEDLSIYFRRRVLEEAEVQYVHR